MSHSLIENCLHEGVALSNLGAARKRVRIEHSRLRGCQQALELGFSEAGLEAHADALTITDNLVGVRCALVAVVLVRVAFLTISFSDADNYGWVTEGRLFVTNSFVRHNRRDVWNWHRATWSAVPDRLFFSGCTIGELDGAHLFYLLGSFILTRVRHRTADTVCAVDYHRRSGHVRCAGHLRCLAACTGSYWCGPHCW